MNTTTDEKKFPRKKMAVIASAIVIIAIIVTAVVWSQFQPTSSAYAEVEYKTIGWYYTPTEDEACLVLNLTVTNKGYTDGVNVTGYGPDFSINISNANYEPTPFVIEIYNSSATTTMERSQLSYTLQRVTLMSGRSDTGTIIFDMIPKQQYNQTFTLKCSMKTTKNQAVNAIISGS